MAQELLTNGGFEGTYVSGVAPGWSCCLGTPAEENATIRSGISAQKCTGNAGEGPLTSISAKLTPAFGTRRRRGRGHHLPCICTARYGTALPCMVLLPRGVVRACGSREKYIFERPTPETISGYYQERQLMCFMLMTHRSSPSPFRPYSAPAPTPPPTATSPLQSPARQARRQALSLAG